MLTMGTDVTRYFVQTTTQLSRLYKAWVGAMAGTKVCLRRPASVTKDTLGNALLLWARTQPPEKLAEMLEPFMNEFDTLWAAKEGGEYSGEAWLPGSVREQTSTVKHTRRAPSKPIRREDLLDGSENFLEDDDPLMPPKPRPRKRG
jgi:hypothetical protein